MKSALITLVLLTGLTRSQLLRSPLKADLTKYLGCVKVTLYGACDTCYLRKHVPGGRLCGPLQPSSDNCVFYRKNVHGESVCVQCKPGFILKDRAPDGQKCTARSTVQGCLDDEILDAEGPDEFCFSCSNGHYARKIQGMKDTCGPAIRNPDPNCMWGAISSFVKTLCARCNAGYAVDTDSVRCLPTNLKGCWYLNQGRCFSCDPYAGYSMGPDRHCFKNSDAVQLA